MNHLPYNLTIARVRVKLCYTNPVMRRNQSLNCTVHEAYKVVPIGSRHGTRFVKKEDPVDLSIAVKQFGTKISNSGFRGSQKKDEEKNELKLHKV